MNLLVTGGTGFIGQNLTSRLLLEGHNVFVLVRNSSDLSLLSSEVAIINFEPNAVSLAQKLVNSNIDCVFHLASLFIAEHKSEDVVDLIDSNIKFGVVLLEAMRIANVKRMINTSTSWEFFDDITYNPACLYAATKNAFESISTYFVKACGFSIITLYIYDTYGKNDSRKKIFQLFKQLILSGNTLKMSPGEQMIDLVHIDDVIDAYLVALERVFKNISSESYGVYTGNPISLVGLVAIIEEVIGKSLKIEWGGRSYREREVMKPIYTFNKLPDWNYSRSLMDGVKQYFSENN